MYIDYELINKCLPTTPVWFIRTSNVKPELIETFIEKTIIKVSGIYVKLACNAMYETSCKGIGKTLFFNENDAVEALNNMIN